MKALLWFFRVDWDPEPRNWSAGLRFMQSLFVAITLMAVPLASLAEKKPGEAASLDKVEVQGEVKPGGNIVAVVHVKLDKNWHLQSNKPSEPSFIPTVLTLSPTREQEPTPSSIRRAKRKKCRVSLSRCRFMMAISRSPPCSLWTRRLDSRSPSRHAELPGLPGRDLLSAEET